MKIYKWYTLTMYLFTYSLSCFAGVFRPTFEFTPSFTVFYAKLWFFGKETHFLSYLILGLAVYLAIGQVYFFAMMCLHRYVQISLKQPCVEKFENLQLMYLVHGFAIVGIVVSIGFPIVGKVEPMNDAEILETFGESSVLLEEFVIVQLKAS